MTAPGFIAGKLRFQGKLATAAVAVSFLVMGVSIAISSGFRHTIRGGIAEMTGDLCVSANVSSGLLEDAPVPFPLPSWDKISALPGVVSARGVIQRPAIVKNGELIHGVLFKGVEGKVDSLMGVSIPLRLSELIGLGAGDSMVAYFVGERLKARKFTIEKVCEDSILPDENLIVYASPEALRRVQGWEEDEVSAVEIELHPSFRMEGATEALRQQVGMILYESPEPVEQELLVTSSRSRYPQLFDWLGLLDFNVLAILILMTVVAGFNMVSGLLIMLFRNIPTIGALKTFGMTDRDISKVFLKVASGVVLKGLLLGLGLSLLFCLVQGTTHLIRLNPANYFVSFVPVHVNIPFLLAASVLSYGIIMLILLIPTLFISRIDPATTVRQV